MPLPAPLLEEMATRRRAESRRADRDRRLDVLRTALECLAWCALGVFGAAWGLHATDEVLGRAVFWAGVGVGNAGWLFSVLAAYRRGERRGDW